MRKIGVILLAFLLLSSVVPPAMAADAGNDTGVCVHAGDFCIGNQEYSLLDVWNGVKNAIIYSFQVVNQASQGWGGAPEERTPTGLSLNVLKSFGVTPSQFVMSCGRLNYGWLDSAIITVGQFFNNAFETIGWSNAMGVGMLGDSDPAGASRDLATGWLILMIGFFLVTNIFLFGFAELHMDEQLFKGSAAGKFAKDIVISTFGREAYDGILGTPSMGEFLKWRLNIGSKVVDYLAPVDSRLMAHGVGGTMQGDSSTAYGSLSGRAIGNKVEGSPTPNLYANGQKRLIGVGRAALYALVLDVMSAFAAVGFFIAYAIVLMVWFAIMSQFTFGVAGNPCGSLAFIIFSSAFWAFWIWEMVKYAMTRAAFFLAAILPRPAVIIALVPFNGGPLPILNVIIEAFFKLFGMLYIVGLVKPAALYVPDMSFIVGVLSAPLLYMLLIITCVGIQVALFWTSQLPAEIKKAGTEIFSNLGRPQMPKVPNAPATPKAVAGYPANTPLPNPITGKVGPWKPAPPPPPSNFAQGDARFTSKPPAAGGAAGGAVETAGEKMARLTKRQGGS